MDSETHSTHVSGGFASAGAIILFALSLICFYWAWWAHQKSSTQTSSLAVFEGIVSSADVQQHAGALSVITGRKLVFALQGQKSTFFVSGLGSGAAFSALSDSLRPGVPIRLWTASAGRAFLTQKRIEARQVQVNNRIVFPLSAWIAKYRKMKWIATGLFVLLFAASIATHLHALRRTS